MQRKFTWRWLCLIGMIALLLSACGTPAPVPTAAPTSKPAATEPAATDEPAATEPAVTDEPAAGGDLVLATTTSTQDSGLLDYLLPDFAAKTGIQVKVIAVGSGQAMETGQNGDADVLLVHSPKAEEQFVSDGYGVDRTAIMHNDYVIVGPAEDPAGIKGMNNAAEAFAKIAAAEAPFISRGDDSGTHAKEKTIWAKAAITPTAENTWYVSAGQGMGAVLTMAEEQQGYTLSDRGTYLARTAEGYALPILVEGDKSLFNPYHVIAVNPEKYPDINYAGAKAFIEWLVAPETQAMIAGFTEPKSGKPLFYPDAAVAEPAASSGGAALKVTGAVNQELGLSEAEVKALPTLDVESTNSKGEAETYTGVAINALLDQAGVKDTATTLVLVADDGYSVEVPLADVRACDQCIVSFRSQGGFSSVLPGFAKNTQVKGVVELQVK